MTKRVKQSAKSSVSSTLYKKVLPVIRQGRSFLIATHINPDGDALGSALALGRGLRALKKKVKIYNEDAVPGNLRFLPDADQISSELLPSEKFDAIFLTDCSDPDRAGDTFTKYREHDSTKLIMIDHHLTGCGGDINVIDKKAPSSGVVVLHLLERLGVKIGREMATLIYGTVVTDTGTFRYSNTTAEVLRLAADLVARGADPWTMARNIYESYPMARLKLMGKVLPTLEVGGGGRYASLVLTRQMLAETGATVELSEEFVNLPRSVATVEVSLLFREMGDNAFKVSLRSKDHVNVAMLAARFGGGGHARAGGFKIKGELSEVKQQVYSAVEEALKALQ